MKWKTHPTPVEGFISSIETSDSKGVISATSWNGTLTVNAPHGVFKVERTRPLFAQAFLQSTGTLFFGGGENRISLCDIETQQHSDILELNCPLLSCTTMHNYLIYGTEQELVTLDLRSMDTISLPMKCEKILTNGEEHAASKWGDTVSVWDLRSRNQPITQLGVFPESDSTFGWTSKNELLYLTENDGMVFYDLTTSRAREDLMWEETRLEFISCMTANEGEVLLASDTGEIECWDLKRRVPLYLSEIPNSIHCVTAFQDKWLAGVGYPKMSYVGRDTRKNNSAILLSDASN